MSALSFFRTARFTSRSRFQSRILLVAQCAALISIFAFIAWLCHDYFVRPALGLTLRHYHLGPALFRTKQGLDPIGPMLMDTAGLLPLLVAGFAVSILEKRRMGEYGLPFNSRALKQFFAGIAWGIGGVSAVLLAIKAAHGVDFGGVITHGSTAVKYGALWAASCLVIALLEEFLFRGFLLFTVARAVTFWPAAIGLSALFAAGHFHNPGETKAGIASVFLFGVLFSFFVRRTGSLWLAVGFHLSWDFTQDFLYGVPDSGLISKGRLLAPVFHGPTWLTGGTVGPEGSVFSPIFLLIMTFAVCSLYRRPIGSADEKLETPTSAYAVTR